MLHDKSYTDTLEFCCQSRYTYHPSIFGTTCNFILHGDINDVPNKTSITRTQRKLLRRDKSLSNSQIKKHAGLA